MADLLSGIAGAMKHLAARQRVVAGNVANSETPGFKARDLAAPDFAGLVDGRVARPQVRMTSGVTALGARGGDGTGRMIADTDVGEVKPDGNNVTLEDQLLKMGQVQADFAAMTNLYRKQQALMRTALGKGGG